MNGQENGSRYNGHNGPLDAVFVGAGFAGMYMLHRLRRLGFTARVIEAQFDQTSGMTISRVVSTPAPRPRRGPCPR